MTLEAFDPDGIQAAAKTIKAKLDGKPVVIPFTVENPRLWDLDHPNLYRMRVSVESDTSRDEIEIATGFRNIRVTPEEGFPPQRLARSGSRRNALLRPSGHG